MRYWYVRAKRFGPPIGNNVDPRHFVSCAGSWCSPADCTWEHVRIGDRVALVRTRQRLNCAQKYTPGLVAFGRVVHTFRSGHDPRQCAYIVYEDFLFDRPISLSRLTSLPDFPPEMFFRTTGRCADRPPGPLSYKQWNILQKEKQMPRRIAPRVQWSAQPGERVFHDQIGDTFGKTPGIPSQPRRSRLVGWNVDLEGRPDRPNAAVRVCERSPNIFITGARANKNVLPDPLHSGAVLVSTSHVDGARLANHVSAGVALRLFALEEGKTSSIYAGQYVIEQTSPVVEDPPAGMPAGYCLRLWPLGETLDSTELFNPPLGREYVRQTRLAYDNTDDLIQRFLSRSRHWKAVNMHRELQDGLADKLVTAGHAPISPRIEDPQFDLAFRHKHELVVVEVKSLPEGSEERQLREGFGQLSKYAEQIRLTGEAVRPVLYVERDPGDPVWESLCARHGIVLAWPETRERIWLPDR